MTTTGDGVVARGLDSHGDAVAVTTRTREHLVRRRHPSVMCAFPPARAPEAIADARAPDEVDRRATPRHGHRHRRRFYGPAFGESAAAVMVVDHDEGILGTMFGIR